MKVSIEVFGGDGEVKYAIGDAGEDKDFGSRLDVGDTDDDSENGVDRFESGVDGDEEEIGTGEETPTSNVVDTAEGCAR